MRILFTWLFSLAAICSFGQSPVSSRILRGVDLGASFKKGLFAPSLNYYEQLNIGRQQVFSIGWTFRTAGVYGNSLAYTTAPARLTRGESGFGALGAKLKESNIDTLQFGKNSQTILNFGLTAQIKLGPIELGGSADILGLTLGRTRLGKVISSTGGYYVASSSNEDSLVYFRNKHQSQYANPRSINVRLLGDNDRGALTTEIYGRIMLTPRIGIKLAYQWLSTEMKLNVDRTLDGNLRYRNRAGMPYIALTFPSF